jgi:uncharacterized glyoxalase superfamily protein PhnB
MTRATLTSAVSYKDPRAAMLWLERAFGFDVAMVIEDDDENAVHIEMRFGDCLIMVGGEWSENHRSPASLGGKNTQAVHIHIESDIDAHYARAKAAGAEIVAELEEQFYGDKTYRCRDPEGHIWTVGQTVKTVSAEEAAAATGLKITGWV